MVGAAEGRQTICPALDVSSSGATVDEARQSLQEAVSAFVWVPVGQARRAGRSGGMMARRITPVWVGNGLASGCHAAARVIADRLEHGEEIPELNDVFAVSA